MEFNWRICIQREEYNWRSQNIQWIKSGDRLKGKSDSSSDQTSTKSSEDNDFLLSKQKSEEFSDPFKEYYYDDDDDDDESSDHLLQELKLSMDIRTYENVSESLKGQENNDEIIDVDSYESFNEVDNLSEQFESSGSMEKLEVESSTYKTNEKIFWMSNATSIENIDKESSNKITNVEDSSENLDEIDELVNSTELNYEKWNPTELEIENRSFSLNDENVTVENSSEVYEFGENKSAIDIENSHEVTNSFSSEDDSSKITANNIETSTLYDKDYKDLPRADKRKRVKLMKKLKALKKHAKITKAKFETALKAKNMTQFLNISTTLAPASLEGISNAVNCPFGTNLLRLLIAFNLINYF